MGSGREGDNKLFFGELVGVNRVWTAYDIGIIRVIIWKDIQAYTSEDLSIWTLYKVTLVIKIL